jgi:diphthine-ammonia ligase
LKDTEVVITDPEPYPVAYLRVGGGRLVKKEGWIRPGVMELRGMLGLNSDEKGTEGLDESSKELLLELRSESPIHEREERIPPLADVEEEGSKEGTKTKGEVVQYRKRGRWFAVSISGMTRGDEEIGHELDRCFKSIQRKSPARLERSH